MADVIPFDQRDGSLWYDGKLVPWKDAKTHVLTHGLHYGSCVSRSAYLWWQDLHQLQNNQTSAVPLGRGAGAWTIPSPRRDQPGLHRCRRRAEHQDVICVRRIPRQ